MKRSLIVALGLLALTAPLPAAAQGASDSIAAIRQQILYARYEEAVGAASQLLQRPDLSALERNETLEVLATAHLANRDNESAGPVLEQLYGRDPGHVIQDADASPLVQGAFQRARENAPSPIAVQIDHSPPAPSVRQSPLVELQLTQGANAVSEVRVNYRAAGSPRFAVAVMEMGSGGIAQARLPLLGTGDQAQRIEYFIVALAPSRTALAALGNEAEPLSLEVPAAGETRGAPIPVDPEDPLAQEDEERSSKWWVALIVVGVAGAAVGGYFLFRGDEPSGTLGHVTLQ